MRIRLQTNDYHIYIEGHCSIEELNQQLLNYNLCIKPIKYKNITGNASSRLRQGSDKMENYTELKARHAKELNDFEGIFFAFNNEQFKEGMEKIGLTIEDKKQIFSLGAGGYIRKDKSTEFHAMFKRQAEEKKTRKQEEKFLFESLVYELCNHEYCITLDPSDALDALGYNKEDIDPKILKMAMAEAI